MADDWTEVHSLTDAAGKRVVIARSGGLVRFAVTGAGVVQCQVVLDGEGRDEFDRGYIAASHAAEARQDACMHCQAAAVAKTGDR